MSSYWGHGAGDERAKGRKRSFRKPRRSEADRRASLPCVSQLETMQLKQFHNVTTAPAPIQLKSCKEKEVHSHPHVHRVASDETSYRQIKGGGTENQISTIPELSESFERMLRSRHQRVMSLGDADNVCLVCHEEIRNKREREGGGHGGGRGGARELHCSHCFHKEWFGKVRRPEQDGRPRSRSSAAVCESRKEVAFCAEPEGYRLPWHRFSLRRQR